MKLIWHYLQKYKMECVIAPLFKLLEACFDLCVPLVVASIVDGGIEAGDVGYIWRMFGLLVLLSVSAFPARWSRNTFPPVRLWAARRPCATTFLRTCNPSRTSRPTHWAFPP